MSAFGEMTDDVREIILDEAERLGLVVIEQITQAFAGVERGNGISLHEAYEFERYSYGDTARAEARLLDTDRRWQDVPESDIAKHSGIVHYLDAEGFRYYAPAYMVWCIQSAYARVDSSNSRSVETLVFTLMLPVETENRALYFENWSLFNPAQSRATCAFLRYMYASYGDSDAGKAVKAYWGQFWVPSKARNLALAAEGVERRAVLIDKITLAFANVERGTGIGLGEAQAIEIGRPDAEREEARRQDTNCRWQDIPVEDIQNYKWGLSFLDARGLRYYAPAFMIWTVRNFDTSAAISSDAIVLHLNLTENPIWKAHALEKWAYFTPEQCVAISAFLRFMAEAYASMAQEDDPWIDPTPTQALTRYWNQFDDPDIDLLGDVWLDLPTDIWLRHRVSRQDHIDALVAQIIGAFDGVERGRGVSLHEAVVIDDHGSDAERAEARRLDTDTRWQDVPEADIERCDWILSFLDAEGFRYYAPAYMVWTLRNIWTSDSMSTDAIVYALDSTWYREHRLEKWALFSLEQRRAICGFLHFMAYEGDGRANDVAARMALTGYWGQFGGH